MGNIYRKASIDRLSSPEQLDKMIRIASPSLWIAVAGAGLVVVCVVIWAVFGRLPDNVSISGLYMSNTGVQGAYASYGGKVSEVMVTKDQKVQAQDVVAVIVNEDSDATIAQLLDRIRAVEGVTLTSKQDESTSDNSKLLEYKLQYRTAGMTLEEKQETLRALRQQLEEVTQKVNTYKANMDAAEAAYLAVLGDDSDNAATFNYQAAQTELQTAQSEYQTVASNVSGLENACQSAEQSLTQLKEQYSTLEQQKASVESSYNSQQQELSSYQTQYDALIAQYPDGQIPESVQQQLALLEQSISSLETSSSSLETQLTEINSGLAQAGDGITAQEAQLLELSSQLSSAQGELSVAQSNLTSAQDNFYSAQSVYGSYYSSQNQKTADKTRLNTDFTEASSLYSNAYSQQQSIEQQIKELSLQSGFEDKNQSANKASLKVQFDATKEALLKDLNTELEHVKASGAMEEIKAKISGTVVDCGVQKGQIIGQGTEVAKIKSGDENAELVRCYVPIAEGKKLEPGMETVVTPSTVNEQEYGHMMATVESVGTYTVSTTEMQQALGNDVAVQALQQQGPSVEVLITLEKDDSTASGYAWSNRKGETVTLTENTPVSVKVRVKEDAPISKLIPFLKSKLDVKVDSKQAAN